MKNKLILGAVLALSSSVLSAQPLTVGSSASVNTLIQDYVGQPPNSQGPDFNLTGVASTITLNNTDISSITGVTLTLDVTGYPTDGDANDGDYYAYLVHDSQISILLNRVGTVDASNPNDFGSPDSGFDITLSDGSPNIHTYLGDSPSYNSDGQLIGTWGPDGRNVSPFAVTAATSPNALLSAFNGVGANGSWTLFIADCSSGDEGTLANWSLSVTGQSSNGSQVPDSQNTFVLLLLGVSGLALIRRCRHTSCVVVRRF